MLGIWRRGIQIRACSSATTPINVANMLRENYEKVKENVKSRKFTKKQMNPRAVFVNNELDLKNINVYGFDYDYTLAVYTRNLYELLYRQAMNRLVHTMKYPEELLAVPYNIDFAIRGLHYDIANCCLLKVDAFNQIQKGTVFRGRRQLSDEEIYRIYGGYSIPDYKDMQEILPQLADLFSLPWAGLLATVVSYFDEKEIEFDPVSLYNDVAASIQKVHSSGDMYRIVGSDLERYVHKNVGLAEFLERISRNGKELFLLTNSPFSFVNKGMTYMMGSEWKSLFKYIVVLARKPTFFQGNNPFRIYDEKADTLLYEKVSVFEHGKIYAGGNITCFSEKAQFDKQGVLYFGDHIYSDLEEPILKLRWHTAAIVPELAREIRSQDQTYWREITWLETLTNLIDVSQKYADIDDESRAIINGWLDERKLIRIGIKKIFNENFGSMFRTFHNPSFFCRRLSRLSDIYTSRLPNLLDYTDEHRFFPRRASLPHEINIDVHLEDMPLHLDPADVDNHTSPVN